MVLQSNQVPQKVVKNQFFIVLASPAAAGPATFKRRRVFSCGTLRGWPRYQKAGSRRRTSQEGPCLFYILISIIYFFAPARFSIISSDTFRGTSS